MRLTNFLLKLFKKIFFAPQPHRSPLFFCLILFSLSTMNAHAQLAVSLEQAQLALAQKTAVLIDIREPDEHASGVAAGARLLPMSGLRQRLGEIPAAPQIVYLICRTQNRSSMVARALQQAGFSQVHYVQGGMSEWAARGWPMVAP